MIYLAILGVLYHACPNGVNCGCLDWKAKPSGDTLQNGIVHMHAIKIVWKGTFFHNQVCDTLGKPNQPFLWKKGRF